MLKEVERIDMRTEKRVAQVDANLRKAISNLERQGPDQDMHDL